MKPISIFRLFSGFLALLCVQAATAQTADGPVGVAVLIKAVGLTFTTSSASTLTLSVTGLNGYQSATAPSRALETPQLTSRLEPGKTYLAHFTSTNVNGLTIQAVPPPGYVMEIERVSRERIILNYGGTADVKIRLLSPMQQFSGRAGTATSLMSGRVFWQASLGSLANGSSAGAIAIINTGAGPESWASLFSPAGFIYEATSSEVVVAYNPSNVAAPYIPLTIRQIIAPEACADVVVTSASQAEIKFYHHDQLLPGTGVRTFSGDPFAWYLINQDGTLPNKVYINCNIRELTSPLSAGLDPVQIKQTMLARTGTAPDFTWTADEWHEGATSLSTDVRVRSINNETIAVSQSGGATVTSRTHTYGPVPWGEEIMGESAGTTNPITISNQFYITSAQAGNYGRLLSTITNGGTWEAYEYYDYSGTTTANAAVAGALYRSHRPFKNSSTTVPANLSTHTAGVVTTYAYAPDVFGRQARPTQVTTSVGGIATSSSTTSYADTASGFIGHDLLYIVTATNNVSSVLGAPLTTVSKYFREDAGVKTVSAIDLTTDPTDDFYRGQPHSIKQPDGRKQSFVYQRGGWDGTAFTPSANGGANYGVASRICVITGSATTGTLYTAYAGYDIDDLYLVDGKSTMQVTIRDASALVRRIETYAWSSSAWQLVTKANFNYNYSNLLTERIDFNGGQYKALYSGEHKVYEQDDTGIRVDYTYDAAGRVSTVTKSSGPKTTFAYDAEHRSVSETVSAAGFGETIFSSRTYDDAGRLKTELPVEMSAATTYTYDPVARTRTATFPDTGTRTETYFADGQLDHVDGSAVVPQYFAYTMESDGKRTTTAYSGSAASARWQKVTTDWLGRATHGESPGFSVSSQAVNATDNTYEAVTGRLVKTTRSGFAPTVYAYDALSNVTRTGLDIGSDGLVLNSTDRIGDNDQYFELINTSWWLRQETKSYPFSNANPVTTAITRKRLTGHPAGRLDETQVTDVEGNTVTRTVDVDRTNAIVTITTTRPSVANTQIETVTNGLATSVRGHDGLTSSALYDPLSRLWKSTDTRNNTSITTYKFGTALVQSVSDGASNNLGTISYDSMGRKQWVQDAAGQYTHFTYNLRGQLTNQWGGGSYPVSYSYDATYGDSTVLNTYRNDATSYVSDPAVWPASSVNTADPTTWTYDGASGLLWKKTDALNQVTEFDYNVRGQTSTRKWSRKLTTAGMTSVPVQATYGYDPDTGELLTKTYNDTAEAIPTPSVTYAYTRLGQVKTVAEGAGGAGSRTFNYNASSPWRLDNEALDASFYASRVITRNYDTVTGTGGAYAQYTPGTFKGRYTGYDLGVVGNTTRDQHVAYTTSNLARFVGVFSQVNGAAGRDYVYTYATSSSLVQGYGTGQFSVFRGYEPLRNVLTVIDSQWNSVSRTRYDYTTNALGQRTTAKQSGTAFDDYNVSGYTATFNAYNYNSRGELETAKRYPGDPATTAQTPANKLPGGQFEYRFDSIGNRKTSGSTGTASDDSYTSNELNQYTKRDNKTVRALGTADAGATVAVGSAATTVKKDRTWAAEISPGNSTGPVQAKAKVYAAIGGLILSDTSRSYVVPQLTQVIGYDLDGNMTSDGVWNYTYNAENQLVRMASALSFLVGFENRWQIDFRYDYAGRRVQKSVVNPDNAVKSYTRRFLYDGANVVAETDEVSTLKRVFTWGLDLAGSRTASGGVGALLQIDDLALSKTLFVTYDGNGNVASLVNSSGGALEATYEYDPSGNLLRSEGLYAKNNPFRFSTKWQDDETGLINYGFRYYSPTLGRFINRDPIGEKGGLNLYGFCGNDGVNRWDYLGQTWLRKQLGSIGNWIDKQLASFGHMIGAHVNVGDENGNGGVGGQYNAGNNTVQINDGHPQTPTPAKKDPGTVIIPTDNSGSTTTSPSQRGGYVTFVDYYNYAPQGPGESGNFTIAPNSGVSALTNAKLSNGIYGKNFTGADGYTMVAGSLVDDGKTGLRTAVFSNGTNNVQVFAGTSPSSLANWWANLTQALGFKSPQYEQGMKSATANYEKYGGNLSFTGHSLGGGIASASAIVTGGSAVTFNAAGVHNNTIGDFSRSNGSVTSYYSTFDVLHVLNWITPSSASVPGQRISLGAAGFHGMGSMVNALGGGGP